MNKRLLFIVMLCLMMAKSARALGVGGNGMYQYSVELTNYISGETGKAPVAYLWIPDDCQTVKAAMLAQQNMTEEAIFRNEAFRDSLRQMGIALVWVAPAFSNNWDPQTPCQTIFENFMTALGYQSGHQELACVPIIPLGHSAQATFPWNFAAWNPDRTLCTISFHGDAPRTNLCGYGTANVEWGRNRNIDGIPGLMVEGEWEWWEARVRPALAFRMMYPQSCISFLADTGHGHFDLCQETADYIARFIHLAMDQRLTADGKMHKVDPTKGWLFTRFHSDMPQNDGLEKGKVYEYSEPYAYPAPWSDYKGDTHNAFWYPNEEMAQWTQRRYLASQGKQIQYVGFEQNGKIVPFDPHVQGGMRAEFLPDKDGKTFHLKAVYTDAMHATLSDKHGKGRLHIEVICGPVRKINDTTFRVVPYEAGDDNPRRSFSVWLCAVGDADGTYRGAVQPIVLNVKR